ncbi:MAG TPA: hypothetical protein VF589_10225 [Allosphingosinicella sp.]|jgi:Ca2+-binding RTX toxin-like protein
MALISITDIVRVDQEGLGGGHNDSQVVVQALSDGGFAIAWREYEENGSGSYRVFTRKYDGSLAAVGDMVKLDGTDRDPLSGNGTGRPSIAALDNGAFAVEYNDLGDVTRYSNGAPYGAYWMWVAEMTAGGTIGAQTTPFGRPDPDDDQQANTIWVSAIAGDGDGGYHYAFVQSLTEVSGHRLVVNGSVLETGLHSNGTAIGLNGVGVTDFGDGVFVTYQRNVDSGDADLWGRFVGGAADGAEFRINTQTAGYQTLNSANDGIAVLSNGSVVVTWRDTSSADDATDPGYGVHARIMGANGVPIGDEFVLSATPGGDEGNAAVAAMSGGRFIAVWHDDVGTVAQVFSSTGERLGDQVKINDNLVTSVTVLADDRVVFAWNLPGQTVTQVFRFPDKFGTGGDDRMRGGAGDDVLHGLAGNDLLIGYAGADELRGGAGNDVYYVDHAGDKVVELPDQGRDRVRSTVDHTLADNVEDLRLAGAAVTGTGNALDNQIFGSSGDNFLYGLAGDDELRGQSGIDRLEGGADADTLYGGLSGDHLLGDGGGDRLIGEAGNDMLEGGADIDTLLGQDGADTLLGGDGADTLNGGIQRDLLTGGAGGDIFLFDDGHSRETRAAADQITDFTRADGDRINLRAIDAKSATPDVDDKFSFIGTQAFSGNGAGGQLRYVNSQGNTFIEGDVDGNGVADFIIRLDGVHALQATDFVL